MAVGACVAALPDLAKHKARTAVVPSAQRRDRKASW